ncbi:MAG: hypothetical protein IKS59_05015, partial [Aeriscardovia sp.]|nr:hypothetical protein [Aeriscardovia sp.]
MLDEPSTGLHAKDIEKLSRNINEYDKSDFVEVAMKNYTQVYVKNSFEAAKTYCKAFGAEITREFKNEDNTAYEHCELSVNGEGFLALAEAKNPCDIDVVHKYKWET